MAREFTIVTGAAQGIGRAISLQLARRGDVCVLVDIDRAGAEAVREDIEASGGEAFARELDLRDAQGIAALWHELDELGEIKHLVNNAGIAVAAALEEISVDALDALLDINVRAPYLMTSQASRFMARQAGGTIVNVGSTSSFVAARYPMSAYDMSKGAIRMLTVSAARELAIQGIRVNAVAPGTVETELVRDLTSNGDAGPDLLVGIPWGRFGKPEEVADVVEYLTSAQSSYVTGQILAVDGGYLT